MTIPGTLAEALRDVCDSLAIPADGKSSQVELKALELGLDVVCPIHP